MAANEFMFTEIFVVFDIPTLVNATKELVTMAKHRIRDATLMAK